MSQNTNAEQARIRTDSGLFIDKGNYWIDPTHPDFAGGADASGLKDSSAAVIAAAAFAADNGWGLVFRPGTYLLSSAINITVPTNIVPGALLKAAAAVTFSAAIWASAYLIFDVTLGGSFTLTNQVFTFDAWGTFTASSYEVGASAFVTGGVTGPAGGDLSGTYPDPTVAKLQGYAVYNTAPSDGQVLEWDNANSRWAPASLPTALPPNGSAGGDLSGTYPNPAVAKLQGYAVYNTAPSDGQVLTWDNANSRWAPATRGTVSILQAYRTNNQSIPAATPTTAVFDAVAVDSDSAYNNTTGVYTSPRAQKVYVFVGLKGAFYGESNTYYIAIKQNSTKVAATPLPNGSYARNANLAAVLNVASGDTLSVELYLYSAGSIYYSEAALPGIPSGMLSDIELSDSSINSLYINPQILIMGIG
jgi:hypothetical protein